jgi:hypothetical protein
MKKAVKEALAEKGLPNYGNRPPHKNCSHNLCVCGDSKKPHFKNALGHGYKASSTKNNLSVKVLDTKA